MGDGRFRRESALYAGPTAEKPELSVPVEFEVYVTVSLAYALRVKATTKKKAWDWAESLSWPEDFQPGGPAELIDAAPDPKAGSLWLDGKLVWERQ